MKNNSKLLKEAIADAKAVRETAIANAKIALEEAFTPRLQSILSQKLQQEIEGDDEEDDDDMQNEEYGAEDAPTGASTKLGAGKDGAAPGTSVEQPTGVHTKLDPETTKISKPVGSEDSNTSVVKEGDGEDYYGDGVIDDPTGASVTEDDDMDADSDTDEDTPTDDDLDLESIIAELEGELDDDSEDDNDDDSMNEDSTDDDNDNDNDTDADGDTDADYDVNTTVTKEPAADGQDDSSTADTDETDDDDDIDLDEILKEMGYGDDDDSQKGSDETDDNDKPWNDEKENELKEAYNAIRSLKGTINEVNLLNAKLLYSNKLFRSYDLTNNQKMKVVETLDRTINVREVKLVFATLAESLKLSGSTAKRRKKITESFASNAVPSTAPKKEIIAEGNTMADRFKELANIK